MFINIQDHVSQKHCEPKQVYIHFAYSYNGLTVLWEISTVLTSHPSSPCFLSTILIGLSSEIQLSRHIFIELTSFSIHGLPRQVAKQPNSPKMMMMAPVPMRTYGALVPLSEFRSRSNSKLTFPHTPTANRITPVNYKHHLSDIFCRCGVSVVCMKLKLQGRKMLIPVLNNTVANVDIRWKAQNVNV